MCRQRLRQWRVNNLRNSRNHIKELEAQMERIEEEDNLMQKLMVEWSGT